ncbi:MAG: diacylglycerol/lipid kinase family protein [Ktedonobacteraceae bacterium]
MPNRKARIVVDLRTGQDVANIPDLIAVLAAAGWKTSIALKEYGGETFQLAQKAATQGYDLVIGYGGDGTLNDVVNGVMAAGGKSLVGDIPGGTFNEWAGTISVPHNPVKAALSIVDSDARKVDLGHVAVDGLTFPNSAGDNQQLETGKKKQKKPKTSSKTRQYFLLHVGMGIDAAIMAHISKPLKYHFGRLAFDLAAIKELPEQHPFPVEVRVLDDTGNVDIRWQGEVWQVIVSKSPDYAGSVDVAPGAHLDDGLLNVCVITASNPIKTIEQALALLARRKLDDTTTHYFRGAHLSISVPASIGMQIDGSVVKLEDFLRKAENDALKLANAAGQVMVSYRFDAEPAALQMTIPRIYNGPLFEKSSHAGNQEVTSSQQGDKQSPAVQYNGKRPGKILQENQKRIEALQEQGYKMTVIGVAPNPGKTGTYLIAASYKKQSTDETEIFGIRVDDRTLILDRAGQQVSPAAVLELQEGEEIMVEGKKNKRYVMRANCLRFSR